MFSMSAEQIGRLVKGDVRGDSRRTVDAVASLEEAGETDVTFAADESMVAMAADSGAGVLITAEEVSGFDGTQIVCEDPELAVCRVLEEVRKERFPLPEGISDSAHISPDAALGSDVSVGDGSVIEAGTEIGDNVTIYPLVYIGRDAKVGRGTVLHPHVCLCDGVQIGQDCTIHPGCVIGDDGFGYIQRDGRSLKMNHVGGVRIGDDVSVGGLGSVDRGMVTDTVVGDGVKLDKHCHIGHNCRLGDNVVIAGYGRLGGSVTVEDNVMMGGDVAVVDHATIGEEAMVAAHTGITRDIEAGARVLGFPPRPINEQMRIYAMEGRLPEMRRELRELRRELKALKEKLDAGE